MQEAASPVRAEPQPQADTVPSSTDSAATVATPSTADPAKFGLTATQLPENKSPQGLSAITAKVTGIVADRATAGRVALQLDNGQVWILSDDDAGVSAGDSVTIKRAALGSYLLTTSAHRSYRVRRTK